jgi:hypothetical protein
MGSLVKETHRLSGARRITISRCVRIRIRGAHATMSTDDIYARKKAFLEGQIDG